MLSASQLPTANIRNDELIVNKAEAGVATATQSAPMETSVSTTVTLSATALMLQATTHVDVISAALDGLQNSDPFKKSKTKSKLDKFLKNETLLILIQRWELEREIRKNGGANSAQAQQKLKNIEQLKDLF